jgi:hypothetical protein
MEAIELVHGPVASGLVHKKVAFAVQPAGISRRMKAPDPEMNEKQKWEMKSKKVLALVKN